MRFVAIATPRAAILPCKTCPIPRERMLSQGESKE